MTDILPPQARTPSPGAIPPAYIPPPYFEYPGADVIDLWEYARRLWEQRRFIAVVVGLVTTLAGVFAFTTPPVYRADVLLAPVLPNRSEGIGTLLGQLGGLGNILETYVGSGKEGSVAESIATLKSRALAVSFINEQNLKPALFPARWDPATMQWRDRRPAPTDLEAYEIFDEDVRRVVADRRTGLVTLTIEWRDPRLVASWANDFAKRANARRRAEAIEEARTSIEYLQQQLAKSSVVEIQQAIYRLIEAQTKTMTVASTREEYAFRIIDPAVTPEKRVRPKRLVLIASGFCLGLIAAIVLSLIRHAVGKRKTAADGGAQLGCDRAPSKKQPISGSPNPL